MRRFIFIAGFLSFYTAISAQDCSELFISEYLEGSGNNKGIEVYNPTSDIIDLSVYYIARYSNGSNTYTAGGITQLQGFIQAYSTHLLVNGQTTSTETSPASDPNLRALAQQLDHDYPAPTYMNGNDAIALFKKTGNTGTDSDFEVIDLFGIIGGGMPSDGSGWAGFTDEWVYKNIYEGDQIVGKDSVYITNFIVPAGYYWLPLSANHSLVRKPGVKHGVTVETMPTVEFDLTIEWDTVPDGVDQWDSLNAHSCDCELASAIGQKKVESTLTVYPNPGSDYINVFSEDGMENIQLFDVSGKMVLNENNLQGIRQKQIDIKQLGKGVYILRIQTGNRILARKISKN